MTDAADTRVDAALLRRVASHDQAALGEIYDRHARVLFGLICRIVHDRAEAEDVLQEVFVRIWERAGTYAPDAGSPIGWMVRVARNRAIDRLRARAARPDLTGDAVPELAAEGTPEATVVLGERARVVTAALAELPPEQRRLIEQAYFGGDSQSELAARFGIPLGTVKTRVRAGMQALRDALRRRGLESGHAPQP